jgi:putative methyltransferase (TIGR04325 family)
MGLRELLKLLVPPLALNGYRHVRRRISALPAEWEYIPEGWNYRRGHPEVRGWNVEEVLDAYRRKWPDFVERTTGTSPFGFSHESDVSSSDNPDFQNEILIFAYSLALAARSRDQLSMLDWGGGVGHYYLLAKAALPGVMVDYHCKDVPILAEHGASCFPDQHFYSDDSCLDRTYQFVLASGSLHYAEDWADVLRRLATATNGFCLVTRLPTVIEADSFVFVQRPYAYGYNTEYLGWCINRQAFIDQAMKGGLRLVREFVVPFSVMMAGAPERCQYRGFLFQRP